MGLYDFLPGDPQQGYSAMDTRRRIALSLMAQSNKKGHPKNLGEGLAHLGDVIGDIGMMKMLERQAAQQKAAADKLEGEQRGGAEPAATDKRADNEAVPLAVQVAEAEQVDEATKPDSKPQQVAALPPSPPPPPSVVETPPPRPQPQPAVRGLPPPPPPGGPTTLASLQQAPPGMSMLPRMTLPTAGFPDPTVATTEPPRDSMAFNDRFPSATQRGEGYTGAYGEARGTRSMPGWFGPSTQLAGAMSPETGPDAWRGMAASNQVPGSRGGTGSEVAALSPQDAAQAQQLAQVTGMRGGPTNQFSYPPTASLHDNAGVVKSDAGGGNGIVNEGVRNSIAETLRQQQQQLPPVEEVPQGPPTQRGSNPQMISTSLPPTQAGSPEPVQVAESVFPNPTVAADGRPAAIIPGGGLPITPEPKPAAQGIVKAPDEYEPVVRPQPVPPKKPDMGPVEKAQQKYLTGDYSPQNKLVAQQLIDRERNRLNADYEQKLKSHEIEKSDWLEEEKQRRDFLRRKNYERAQARGEVAKAGQEEHKLNQFPEQLLDEAAKRKADAAKAIDDAKKSGMEVGGYAQRLKVEADERLAKVQEAEAKATTQKEDTEFQSRTGLPRTVFIPEFLKAKESASKAANTVTNLYTAKEALDSGAVVSGWGANAQFNLAKIGARIGSADAAKIAYQSERYRQAMDSTINTAVQMIQGNDPKVTNSDIDMAKGLTGTPEMQEAAKRRIIEAALERQHSTIGKYEGDREFYLRGDKQHRYFKVDAPALGSPTMRKELWNNREKPDFIAEFDRQLGKGASAVELARAKRREERVRKAAEEDD